MNLQRSISTFALLMISVGSIVGSGWLFGPLYVAQAAGPAAVLCWILGGTLMIFIALTFAELATMFPIAGGMVRFVEFTHGTLVSFTLGWVAWLAAVVVAPIETLAMIQYSSNYIPGMMTKTGSEYLLTYPGIGIAAVLMLTMCYINMIGAKWVSKTNIGIVFIKLVVPLIVIIMFFSTNIDFSHFTMHGDFFEAGAQGILRSLPTAGVIFSFIGFSPAIQMAGESKNPQRALPIAIVGSLVICMILYTLLQASFINALPIDAVKEGWQAISFPGEAGPFAGLATVLGMMWLVYLLYFDATISPFGTALLYTTATARINYALSKNGVMPERFQDLNNQGVPMKAVMINFCVGLFLFLPFPGWEKLVSFLVLSFVFVYAVGPIALLSLRYTMPDKERPFKLPVAHAFTLIAFYICNLIIFWTGFDTIWKVLVAITCGYLYLCFYRLTSHGKELAMEWAAGWWIFPYLIGTGILSYLGSFGHGTGTIPFGVDFIIIGLFSGIIFYFAIKAAILRSQRQS